MLRRLRLALHKGEELRFLSHLDYAQAVERMIRRANIAMAYSEGFNPHMKISFSSALALGVTAEQEYADLEVLEEGSCEELIDRLNATAPKGLEVLGGRFIEGKTKKLMAICNYAVYEVEGILTDNTQDWNVLLAPLNEAEEFSYEKVTPKRTKMIDLKHFLKKPILFRQNGDRITLTMEIGIYPEGSVKPAEVWKLGKEKLGWPINDDYAIHRKAILIEGEHGYRTPFEVE